MMNFLIVVDMQNDFVTGTLGSKRAEMVIPTAAARIRGFDGEVVYTMDTHHENYLSTQEGGRLPVEHCMEGSWGWELQEDIQNALRYRNALDEAHCVKKSAFGARELPVRIEQLLLAGETPTFTLIGFVTDICVVTNAMLLKSFFPEAPIYVDAACCAGTTPHTHEAAITVMKQCQISVVG